MKKFLQPILFKEVDNAPLIVFRIIFGFLVMAEAWGAILTGWVHQAFIEPSITFPFMFFSWLEPLPGNGMYYYYGLMGLAGLFVMFGHYYRSSMAVYAIMWAAAYFMQKTNYNNHYYLLMLLNFIMLIVPAHRYYSFDVRRNRSINKLSCPQWCMYIFVAQITIVYTYAAVAKMYPDWIEGRPIHIWFESKKDYFLVGPLLAKEWFQHTVAWGGILFDLLIAPALIWKKTRKFAFVISIFFHLFNSAVFQVGIFPYLGIAFGIFFFPPDTIRRIFFRKKPALSTLKKRVVLPRYSNLLMVGLAIYFLFQILLPLRHWMFPGNVNWTEEGHRLSWHMMLRVKSGYVQLRGEDHDTNTAFTIDLSDYLTDKQARSIATRPDMFYQFIQILKKDLKSKGLSNYSIYANSMVSLNGRKTQPLYSSTKDMTEITWQPFDHSDWLVPLADESESELSGM
jgi:vitamin K-dependent gamma-carboxylase